MASWNWNVTNSNLTFMTSAHFEKLYFTFLIFTFFNILIRNYHMNNSSWRFFKRKWLDNHKWRFFISDLWFFRIFWNRNAVVNNVTIHIEYVSTKHLYFIWSSLSILSLNFVSPNWTRCQVVTDTNKWTCSIHYIKLASRVSWFKNQVGSQK